MNTSHRKQPPKSEIRTSSVLFVEQSRRGSLDKAMRYILAKLEPMLSYWFKVVESALQPVQIVDAEWDK